MKKFVIALSMAIMGAGVFPLAMNAQNNNNQGQEVKTECCKKDEGEKKGKCDKKEKFGKVDKMDKKDRYTLNDSVKGSFKKGGKRVIGDSRVRPMKNGYSNPLDGIELTDIQKSKVQELSNNQKEAFKKIDKEAREKKDKAIDKFEKDLKNILTPEQYAQFEQNKAKAQKMKAQNKEGKKNHDKKAKKNKNENKVKKGHDQKNKKRENKKDNSRREK